MKHLHTVFYALVLAVLAAVRIYVLDPLEKAYVTVKCTMRSTLNVTSEVITRALLGPVKFHRAGELPRMPNVHRLLRKTAVERRRPLISPRWRHVPST